MEKQPLHNLETLLVSVAKLHFKRAQMIFNRIGLFRGQPPVLFALWEQDGQTHKQLSDKLKVKPATTTVILQRMERAGFLYRQSDPNDLRVSRVFLTDKGRKIQKKVETGIGIMEKELFTNFSTKELQLATEIFTKIKHNLKQAIQEEKV